MIIKNIILRNKEAVLNLVDYKDRALGILFVTDYDLINSLRNRQTNNLELIFKEG